MPDGDGALDDFTLPRRADVLGPKSLGQLARELAQSYRAIPGPLRNPIPQDIARLRERLEDAYARIAEAQAADRTITPAAQWLLDNFHVVGENLNALPGLLPRALIQSLPRVTVPTPAEEQVEIRIRGVLRRFSGHVDSRFQAAMLSAFLHSYQEVEPFTMGELWAVPSFFRLAILETLADIAEGTARALDARRAADELADLVLGQHAGAPADRAPATSEGTARLPDGGLQLPFIVQLVERLRYRSDEVLEILDDVTRRVATEGLTLDECVRREHHRQSANNASAAHIIGSLREIDAVDWRDIFGELSVVEKALATVRSYELVDEATREQYRRTIADLALRSGLAEAEVAVRARDAALASPNAESREADLGWHLVAEGRPALEAAIRYRPSPAVRLRRSIKRHPVVAYLGAIAFLTTVFLGWAISVGFVAPGPEPWS